MNNKSIAILCITAAAAILAAVLLFRGCMLAPDSTKDTSATTSADTGATQTDSTGETAGTNDGTDTSGQTSQLGTQNTEESDISVSVGAAQRDEEGWDTPAGKPSSDPLDTEGSGTVPNAGENGAPGLLTYAQFLDLSPSEQEAYYRQFSNPMDYVAWLDAAQEEHYATQPTIIVTGPVDLEDLVGGN